MADYNQLLRNLAKNIGANPDKLSSAIQKGDTSAIASLLNGKQATAFKQIISDPDTAKKILNSKEALDLQRKLKH